MGFESLSLKGRALRLLGQREHSRQELQRKLAPHVQEGDDLPALLDELEHKGFISEARVIESVLHQKAARMGSARIRQALQAKGVDAQAVGAALEQLKDSELERAREVWRRKFGQPAEDAKAHARQVRFLMARGFGADTVRTVLRDPCHSDEGGDGSM